MGYCWDIFGEVCRELLVFGVVLVAVVFCSKVVGKILSAAVV